VTKKKCVKCGIDKDKSNFPKGNKGKNKQYQYPYCKECHILVTERNRLKRLFNITPEERDIMFVYQNNACAICGRVPKFDGQRLSIDHNHKTGLIRGGLCWICNRTLGMVKENIDLMHAMISYLQDPPAIKALGERRYGRLGAIGNKNSTVQKLMKDRQKWLKVQEEILSKGKKDGQ
jgi:hypothetical protein